MNRVTQASSAPEKRVDHFPSGVLDHYPSGVPK